MNSNINPNINSNINLEPRLIEFIKRKKFNEKHNINPDIPLERQYQITNEDLKVIKNYINNNITDNSNNYSDMIEIKKQKFISENEIYDERLNRIQEKMKRERDANLERNKTQNLNYDMFRRNFSSALGDDVNDEFNLNSVAKETNPDKIKYNKYLISDEQLDNKNYYNYSQKQHITPKIMYNQPVNNNEMTNIFGNINAYKNKINSSYSHNADDTGFINEPLKPSDCREEVLANLYGGVGSAQGGGNDSNYGVDVENYVKYGFPTSKAKSLGFENPVEHYFQYIDDDIQKPEHVLFDRPVDTRMSNRQNNKPKSREIY